MKTPDRSRTGSPPSAQNGPTELYFSVSCYRGATIRASPTTFHTVSLRSTLSNWLHSKPPRLGVPRKPVGVLSSRCAQATRKMLRPRKILPQERVGVFAGGALPGTLRIAEVDSNCTRAGETIWEEELSDEDYSVASFRGQD
jgi:hypothetical protein